jgi:hypothetical protein
MPGEYRWGMATLSDLPLCVLRRMLADTVHSVGRSSQAARAIQHEIERRNSLSEQRQGEAPAK